MHLILPFFSEKGQDDIYHQHNNMRQAPSYFENVAQQRAPVLLYIYIVRHDIQ